MILSEIASRVVRNITAYYFITLRWASRIVADAVAWLEPDAGIEPKGYVLSVDYSRYPRISRPRSRACCHYTNPAYFTGRQCRRIRYNRHAFVPWIGHNTSSVAIVLLRTTHAALLTCFQRLSISCLVKAKANWPSQLFDNIDAGWTFTTNIHLALSAFAHAY
jgi:hypothetical protein